MGNPETQTTLGTRDRPKTNTTTDDIYLSVTIKTSPIVLHLYIFALINIRATRRGKQEWTIQRHWEYRTHDENKQEKTQPTHKTNNKQPRSNQTSGVNPGAHDGLVVPAS